MRFYFLLRSRPGRRISDRVPNKSQEPIEKVRTFTFEVFTGQIYCIFLYALRVFKLKCYKVLKTHSAVFINRSEILLFMNSQVYFKTRIISVFQHLNGFKKPLIETKCSRVAQDSMIRDLRVLVNCKNAIRKHCDPN